MLLKRKEEELIDICEQIDQVITLDIAGRGIIKNLYKCARRIFKKPLTLIAAKEIDKRIKKGDVVFIATGCPDRQGINVDIAESDGPPGTAILARALNKGFSAVPFILIEENLIPAMSMVANAAGLRVLPPREAEMAPHYHASINTVSILPFPLDKEKAIDVSKKLIRKYKPKGVITIEKTGMNEKEIIHSCRGADTTKYTAKVDFLVREAIEQSILTIGIGDGGNEIGMGLIREEIQEFLPYGNKCRCPCGAGIAPSTKTDYLITAAISNWGAYGLTASLAVLKRNPDIFHCGYLERRVLEKAADAQLIDGISGYTEPGADGLSAHVHVSFVELLRELVIKGIKKIEEEK